MLGLAIVANVIVTMPVYQKNVRKYKLCVCLGTTFSYNHTIQEQDGYIISRAKESRMNKVNMTVLLITVNDIEIQPRLS